MTSFRPNARHNGGPPLDASPTGQTGWIKVRRSMRVHEVVGFGMQVMPADPERRYCFSRAEAWIDMIMECRYSDGTVMNGTRRMEIKTGQLLGAVSWLASRWNWTPKTVRAFLERLEAHGMIEQSMPGVDPSTEQDDPSPDFSSTGRKKGQQKGTQARILSVCNYPIYQFTENGQGQALGHDNGSPTASQGLAKGNTLRKEEDKKIEDMGVGDAQAREAPRFSTLCVPQSAQPILPPIAEPVVPPVPVIVGEVVSNPVREVEAEFSFRPASRPHHPIPAPSTPVPQVADGPRGDETEVGNGVFLNCETVRHRAFTISLTGIAIQLATNNSGLSKNEATDVAREAAIGHALQWAAEIDNGRHARDVLPSKIANFLVSSIMSQRRRAAAATEKGAASPPAYSQGGWKGAADKEHPTARLMRLAAEERERLDK